MENKKRLIDAKFAQLIANAELSRDDAGTVQWVLSHTPTVDAVEVVHGRWIKDGDWLICLNCESEINIKNSLGIENHKNYCPNCGAKMDGDENG